MLPRSDGVARYGAACVLVYLSVVALALLASATAQTVPLSGSAQVSPSPSPSVASPARSPRSSLGPIDEGTPPSYWPTGLWGPFLTAGGNPARALASSNTSGPNPFAAPPSGLVRQASGSSSSPANGPAAAWAARTPLSEAGSPLMGGPRTSHLETQTVSAVSSVPDVSIARQPGRVSAFSLAQPPGGQGSPVTSFQSAMQTVATQPLSTAPAVAGPVPVPSQVSPPSIAVSPATSPGRGSTVVVRPGVAAPAPAPQKGPAAGPAFAMASLSSPSLAIPPSGQSAIPSSDTLTPSRNPFEPPSRVPTSAPISGPSGTNTTATPSPSQGLPAVNATRSPPKTPVLSAPAASPNVSADSAANPSPAPIVATNVSAAAPLTAAAGGSTDLQTVVPSSNGLSTLSRVGTAPFAGLGAPAPSEPMSSNPYNTLTPGTDPLRLSAMVVELLLTGQSLYPFDEPSQYAVATAANNLLSRFPHIVELSNIGIVAVITPVSANGSGNASDGAPDLALIGVPVVSPYPLPPRPAAPPVNSPGSKQAGLPAPAALPRVAVPSPSLAVSLPPVSATPTPASSSPPATTPAPALSASLLIQPPSAASGRRRLLASPNINYDVGGAQHVAVNCTVTASGRDLAAIQAVLNDSVRGGDFVLALNKSGLAVEKVEIVLFQQISGPLPPPAPAPAPLAEVVAGLPVTPSSSIPGAQPVAPVAAPSPAQEAISTGVSKAVTVGVSVAVPLAAVLMILAAAGLVFWKRSQKRKAAAAAGKSDTEAQANQGKVHGNGLNGGWSGSDGAGKRLRADGSINVRTDNVEAGGASYEGISPDSVCAGHDAVNGMASPARRAPSGMSEWGTTNDGTAINSRDQLLSHQRATSSHPSGAGSPHAQQSVLHNGGGSGTYQKHGGLVMYDSAAENRAGNSNAAMLGRNGSGPGTHDFARQGTLAGDLSLPSDADTPHSRTTSTPNSIGRLQRIGAAQLWQVHMDEMQIQKQIGEGSFGKVYLAKWKETTVAVKILTSTSGSSDDDFPTRLPNPLLQSLEKEAGMMAAMRHPNVVLYLGVCLDPPCVVTEYCARGSLNDVLKRALYNSKYAEQLDWRVRLSMALDAAKGMNYLHTSDPPVIHRDLKSPNLLVDKHWRVKVCDFNLSRVMEESAVLSSMAATNPRWLAPEILAGRGYTFSSDIYSFGIILWEFLTWRVPWHEYGPWQVVAMVTDGHQRPEIPSEDACPSPSFPGMDEYVDLMRCCWRQEAKERPSFAEIIQVLRRLLADEARRVPAKLGDTAPDRALPASSSGSADTARPPQGSSSSEALRKQGSGDSMSGAGGVRLHPSNGLGEVRGSQAHASGSPSTSGRGDVPQHARSESLGSDTHLQALAGRLGSGTQYGADTLGLGESPRSRASSDQCDSLGRGPAHPGYRDGTSGEPLTRKEGPDGSGQLSSNGDWDNLSRIHALLKEAHSETSSNPVEGALSPPDSRVGSLAGPRQGSLPPVGERDERSEAAPQ